jgi:hypothetical protein
MLFTVTSSVTTDAIAATTAAAVAIAIAVAGITVHCCMCSGACCSLCEPTVAAR